MTTHFANEVLFSKCPYMWQNLDRNGLGYNLWPPPQGWATTVIPIAMDEQINLDHFLTLHLVCIFLILLEKY